MAHVRAQSETTAKRRRTCVACGKQDDKMGLFRLVRTEEGKVAYDSSGKRQGRGDYVCCVACMERAYKTKRIERALRPPFTRQDYERIADSLSGAARTT